MSEDPMKELAELVAKKNAARLVMNDRIVTVATAALAVSITFRGAIAGPGAMHVWLLKGAWIGLGLALVCGVFTHAGLINALERTIAALWDNKKAAGSHDIYDTIQFLAIVGFIGGFVCLIGFGMVNTH
jgi:hypothetical protein